MNRRVDDPQFEGAGVDDPRFDGAGVVCLIFCICCLAGGIFLGVAL